MEGYTLSLTNWFHKHVNSGYYEFIIALEKRRSRIESGSSEVADALDQIPIRRIKPKKKKKKKMKKSQKYTNKNFRRYRYNR